jgi:hypothetical protein
VISAFAPKMHQSPKICTKILLVNDLPEGKRQSRAKRRFKGKKQGSERATTLVFENKKRPKSLQIRCFRA